MEDAAQRLAAGLCEFALLQGHPALEDIKLAIASRDRDRSERERLRGEERNRYIYAAALLAFGAVCVCPVSSTF